MASLKMSAKKSQSNGQLKYPSKGSSRMDSQPIERSMHLGDLQIKAPAIVASLSGEAASKARLAEELGADLVEIRLDLICGDPRDEIKSLRKATRLPIIATNRMIQEGGKFCGDEEERISLLAEAAEWADIVDVEFRAKGRDSLMGRVDKPFIVSYHDFKGMPSYEELKRLRDEMFKAGSNIAKIAVTPQRLSDCLSLIELLLETKMHICLMGMGPLGRHLRVMAPIYGSVLTYGYIDDETAPGQISVKDLKAVLDMLVR